MRYLQEINALGCINRRFTMKEPTVYDEETHALPDFSKT